MELDLFLVVARAHSDDLPVGVFATYREAKEFAESEPEPNEAICDQFNADVKRDDVIAYHVVHFYGGEPAPEICDPVEPQEELV